MGGLVSELVQLTLRLLLRVRVLVDHKAGQCQDVAKDLHWCNTAAEEDHTRADEENVLLN